uniref:Uncharacterized protein n=1 Tax=Thermogemmatispora argillosa TaxID=2045280 RepID=A0A455T7C8_9CHLR|nr:hypothetical protein KTA_28530 [Thermogemmatispora argillosa]
MERSESLHIAQNLKRRADTLAQGPQIMVIRGTTPEKEQAHRLSGLLCYLVAVVDTSKMPTKVQLQTGGGHILGSFGEQG